MTKRTLSVLKAWKRIFELLECINDHPYDRDGFQEAVLRLYEGKSPKSVFRGMAIPTLRRLGFIVGYGDVIRISANGALVHRAHQVSKPVGLRALRAVLMEIDEGIGLLSYLEDKTIVPFQSLMDEWTPEVKISDRRVTHKPEARSRAARERIRDWVDFLAFAQLLFNDGQSVLVDADHLEQARHDTDASDKLEYFRENFFAAYKKTVVEQKGIKTVEIEYLRKEVAIRAYDQYRLLVTEKQFDVLLGRLPKTSDQYTITFGRSMGAEEKLFFFQGKYYQTVSVRFYN